MPGSRGLAARLGVVGLAAVVLGLALGRVPATVHEPATAGPAIGKFSPRVREWVASMTIEQKVGQILHVGFPGVEPGPEVEELIRRYHVGGVILFARNVVDPVQVARLTNALQEMALSSGARVPLLVSVDQEGGLVARLTRGATVFPGNMALGAADSETLAYRAGLWTARELRAVGIHQNYAPALDVNNNPANPVIGVRSFGESPHRVAALGVAMIRGLQDGGVLATAKHFPGHGDTAVDSHIDLPTVPHPMERLREVELVPFEAAIQAGVASIMTAHVTFPAVDPTPGLPATLSPRVLTDLLRETMGFEGLLVTDAIEMGAIAKRFGIEDAAVRAVQAGADVVLVGWPQDWTLAIRVARRLVEAARSGEIPATRLDEAVSRVMAAKERVGLLDGDPRVDVAAVPQRVGSPEARSAALEAARRSVTRVADPNGFVPLGEGRRLLVVVPRIQDLTGVEDRGAHTTGLGAALAKVGFQVEERTYPLAIQATEAERLLQDVDGWDAVVVGTYRAWDQRYAGQIHLARVAWQRRLGRPTIVVALREPYDLGQIPDGPALLATYGTTAVSLQALAEVLAGRTPADGRLPVGVPGRWPVGHRWQP
ncbi:MAG TPA: beta-N-acetylhexosaminidase [Limnochordales bacterium]